MAEQNEHAEQNSVFINQMYESWFLDYASYVILERAVPAIEDGLKPVQRRILHAMREMDDGRYNKIANVIGQTMQYHPHGDASIGDAIINLGQKDLLIDTQGNWGDVRTGDSAAARASLAAIEEARAKRCPSQAGEVLRIVISTFGLGSAIGDLGIAVKRNRLNKEKVRWELQPWIVEAALNRLGACKLTEEEQREVWSNTRTPEKVNWPKWWTVQS